MRPMLPQTLSRVPNAGRIFLAFFTGAAVAVSVAAQPRASVATGSPLLDGGVSLPPTVSAEATSPEGVHDAANDVFDHAVHAGLFPTCSGCHVGAAQPAGDMYPPTASCASCHDGVELETVQWEGATPAASLLTFDHTVHRGVLDEAEETAVCTSCHAEASEGSPAVTPTFDACTSCHTHETEDHTAQASCSTCHTTAAAVPALSLASADFTRPADHDSPGFLEGLHGEGPRFDEARCATCHTADRCATCHVDAGIPQITSLGAWPASTPAPEWTNTYPVPATHETPDFARRHWGVDSTAEDCSTCHTQDDCASCHAPPLDRWGALSTLTPRSATRAAGAELERAEPSGHAVPRFEVHHQIEAEVSATECVTCHTEDSCVACHEGVRTPVYHEPGYEAGHAADAASRFMDCSACHDTVVFCRACHAESGIMDQSVGAAYHDAEPLWLFRHGQAARQTLEGCVSCHEQRDCTRCHSSVGAFRVSPHGPGFDPDLAQDKNPRACTLCHLSNPIGR